MDLGTDDVGLSVEFLLSFNFFFFFFLECHQRFLEFRVLLVPQLTKKIQTFRDALRVTEGLAITLRYPGTVDSHHSMLHLLKIQRSKYR